jgi:hypothetical protein
MHILIFQDDFAHEIIEKQLGVINLYCLLIFPATLKDVANFKHEKEIGRLKSTLLIFVFSQLPISHHIPDHVSLPNWAFIKLLIVEINNLIEIKQLWIVSVFIDSKPIEALLF